MNGKKKLKKLLGLATVITVVGLIHNQLSDGVKVINEGVSFGIEFDGAATVVWVVLAVMTSWWWLKEDNWGWIMILAGGWINMADRLMDGGVVDYWRLPWVGLNNNLPDWLIFWGFLTVLGRYIIKVRPR